MNKMRFLKCLSILSPECYFFMKLLNIYTAHNPHHAQLRYNSKCKSHAIRGLSRKYPAILNILRTGHVAMM